MREINKLIVHCSATKPSMNIGVDEIRRWHVDENGWDDVGYHVVIKRNGYAEKGRQLSVVGAHSYGNNGDSIGVCLVGGISESGEPECNFTFAQYGTLSAYISTCIDRFPNIKVIGHNQVSEKDCPCFNVESFVESIK